MLIQLLFTSPLLLRPALPPGVVGRGAGAALVRMADSAASDAGSPGVAESRAPVGDESHEALGGDESQHMLGALEKWLREQPVESILSRDQAAALLQSFRDDGRFWAQQRRQYARLWHKVEEGMSREERPLSEMLGDETSARLLDALEQMDTDEALVASLIRSEVAEKLLGHVLYEGIFAFVLQADLLGNAIATLPLLGPIRAQMIRTARQNVDALLGDQVAKFLGGCAAATRRVGCADLRPRACRHFCSMPAVLSQVHELGYGVGGRLREHGRVEGGPCARPA